jgi:hypothetical protein
MTTPLDPFFILLVLRACVDRFLSKGELSQNRMETFTKYSVTGVHVTIDENAFGSSKSLHKHVPVVVAV